MSEEPVTQKPHVRSILFCDEAILDARTSRMTLVNLLFDLPLKRTGVLYPKVCLVLAMTAGHGKGTIGVALTNPAGETIGRARQEVSFQSPLQVLCQVFAFANIMLAQFGDYTATITWNDELLEQASFKVFQRKPAAAK